MQGWDVAYTSDAEYYTKVWDEDSRDYVELILNKNGTLVVISENIKLNARGIGILRKKLQQIERNLKDPEPAP